jgi:hypothetical protein
MIFSLRLETQQNVCVYIHEREREMMYEGLSREMLPGEDDMDYGGSSHGPS